MFTFLGVDLGRFSIFHCRHNCDLGGFIVLLEKQTVSDLIMTFYS